MHQGAAGAEHGRFLDPAQVGGKLVELALQATVVGAQQVQFAAEAAALVLQPTVLFTERKALLAYLFQGVSNLFLFKLFFF